MTTDDDTDREERRDAAREFERESEDSGRRRRSGTPQDRRAERTERADDSVDTYANGGREGRFDRTAASGPRPRRQESNAADSPTRTPTGETPRYDSRRGSPRPSERRYGSQPPGSPSGNATSGDAIPGDATPGEPRPSAGGDPTEASGPPRRESSERTPKRTPEPVGEPPKRVRPMREPSDERTGRRRDGDEPALYGGSFDAGTRGQRRASRDRQTREYEQGFDRQRERQRDFQRDKSGNKYRR